MYWLPYFIYKIILIFTNYTADLCEVVFVISNLVADFRGMVFVIKHTISRIFGTLALIHEDVESIEHLMQMHTIYLIFFTNTKKRKTTMVQ